MIRFVFHALFGLLCLSSMSISARVETLMDNVVVLRVQNIDGSKEIVRISCGQDEGRPVTWRKNGVLMPELQGNNIDVMVQEWQGGNYTCHHGPEGAPLSYTVIMIQLEPDNRTVILEEQGHNQGYIHCSTPNYRGRFHCSWSRTEVRQDAAVLLVKGHRNQENIQCVVDTNGSGMWCEDNNCPYKEEKHQISLTVYMQSDFRLEAYTKTFYLRDIVTPELLQSLHYHGSGLFKWDYPTSWERPCSFFSLLFQVKVMHNGESCDSHEHILMHETSEMEFKVPIKPKRYVFCVRAQDKITGGPWSPWNKCIVIRDQSDCTSSRG